MLRSLATFCVLCFAVSSLAPSARSAELRGGASLLAGMAGYTTNESQQSREQVGGGSFSLSYSRTSPDERWSGGLVFRLLESDEDFVSNDGANVSQNIRRIIAGVQGRYYLTRTRFSSYVSPLVGVHMQTAEQFEDNVGVFRDSNQTFMMGFSVGGMFHATRGIFLQAEYTFHYISKSVTIKNNHLSAFYGGIGFQFGGV